jgi:hypothetical protein
MSNKTDTLESKIDAIDTKAANYETATNFEAKKQEYVNALSTIEKSLGRVERRLERMEFLDAVLVDVLETRRTSISEVEDARANVRSIVDYDADYYYELVDQNEKDPYEQRVQQTRSNVESAIDVLKSELREEEDKWLQRVDAARNVQRLFGDSRDMSTTFNDIETFVENRMWDDSESITTLQADWQGLKKSWERSGADWETFQKEYDLSNGTIALLKELAKGNEVKLERMDESTVSELFSVDDLQDVAKLTI